MDFGTLRTWADRYDVLVNRVGICNEILGCARRIARGNPVQLVQDCTLIRVITFKEYLGQCEIYDLAQLDELIDLVERWQDCIWLLSANGYITKRNIDINVNVAV